MSAFSSAALGFQKKLRREYEGSYIAHMQSLMLLTSYVRLVNLPQLMNQY